MQGFPTEMPSIKLFSSSSVQAKLLTSHVTEKNIDMICALYFGNLFVISMLYGELTRTHFLFLVAYNVVDCRKFKSRFLACSVLGSMHS